MTEPMFDIPETPPSQSDKLQVLVHFAEEQDRRDFEALIGRHVRMDRGPSRRAVDPTPAFGPDEEFRRDWATWKGMPEYTNEDLQPVGSTTLEFDSEAELVSFEALVGQTFQRSTRRLAAIWYPKAGHGNYSTKRYRSIEYVPPRFPVFVPTKGRADSRYTIRTFDEIGVPYRAVVQPQEVDEYVKAGVDESRILVLPFSSRPGENRLVDTRNWIWDRALEEGHRYFWTFDDNIRGLFRLNRNLKTPLLDGTVMRAIEDYALRYANLPLCGMNYFMFAVRKGAARIPPVYLNNRVYSNGLIETDYRDPRGRPYRNEGTYNDDTDLNLRILKDGNCTVLFNAFLIYKMVTMTTKGGIPYQQSDEKEKDTRWIASDEIARKHPDVARVTHKFGRWHHQVDYGPFRKNELKLREGVVLPEGTDDYGMVLERVDPQTGEHVVQDSPWYPWEDGR